MCDGAAICGLHCYKCFKTIEPKVSFEIGNGTSRKDSFCLLFGDLGQRIFQGVCLARHQWLERRRQENNDNQNPRETARKQIVSARVTLRRSARRRETRKKRPQRRPINPAHWSCRNAAKRLPVQGRKNRPRGHNGCF